MLTMRFSSQTIMQISEEATGEFDLLGTLFVLALIIAFAYIARWTWKRAATSDGVRRWGWAIVTLVFGGLALIGVFSVVVNLLVALGIL